MSRKKVLFTGEAGSLSRTIISQLPTSKFTVVSAPLYDQFRVSKVHPWAELDITKQYAIDTIVALEPDIVVHSAAVVNTDKCDANPQNCVNVNLMGTHNVLEACKRAQASLMYFSTTATYNPIGLKPYKEYSPQRPPTLYGITKYAGELLVTGQETVPWVVVRPCFICGYPPYDHSSQLVKVGVHSLLKVLDPERTSERVRVTLDPEKKKDYMAVEDFASAVVELLKGEFWGQYFNVSLMQAHPVEYYFSHLGDLLGCPMDMQWLPEFDYMGDHTVSSERIRACTSWAPRISAPVMLGRLATEIKKYVNDVKKGSSPLLYA